MVLLQKIKAYLELIRFHKPIGTFLVLFPSLTALWIAKAGVPDSKSILIFILGAFFMRSAGCAINDFADRRFDGFVARTKSRPLPSGQIQTWEALMVAGIFFLASASLLYFCSPMAQALSPLVVLIAVVYPFLKRFFKLPQLGLGVAFAMGIPMAFAQIQGQLPLSMLWIFLAGIIFPLMYDTQYACVDREDDLKIGIYSSAIWFGKNDLIWISVLQILFLILQMAIAEVFHLGIFFYSSILISGFLFLYQQYLMRIQKHYFQAFLNNQWVALSLFLGVACHYLL